ncbi:DedA family protein [Alicyclobacillus sp. SO9]|uniref:DedA family protein n=1 Tax=Alicyclobacillus sp. SO9 TaxID=2665646 RepID=UPI0018E82AEE|nr:DedA family protein [Alicyclobacillus sp. SO9]QQE77623.1 DedA family protein [Alicyclobacillus sp. SO9]
MHLINHLIQNWGYWGLVGGMALEYSIIIPVPAETTLTATGILYQQHTYHFKLIWLVTAASMGTFSGAMIAYFIGRALGRPFLERFGKYVRLTPARIDKAEQTFQKYTIPTLAISRYIAFVRIFVPYIAGINRIRLRIFAPVILIASIFWTTTFILAGSVIDRAIMQVIHHWKSEVIPAVLILIVLGGTYWWFHRWMHHKMNAQLDGQDDSSQNDSSKDDSISSANISDDDGNSNVPESDKDTSELKAESQDLP